MTKCKPLVEVSWIDACSDATETVEDGEKISLIGIPAKTVGFLLHKGKNGVAVAQAEFDHSPRPKNYKLTFQIPAGMIKKIRYLK